MLMRLKVFISYSHDSAEHSNQILLLSNRLREDGIDCNIDQYETSPPEGWPNWMAAQIQSSQYILVVCTETYKRRVMGQEEEGKGRGAKWEGAIITQEIYDSGGRNEKFIPIVLSTKDLKHIPVYLGGATHYNLSIEEEYISMYRHLTDQPVIKKPPLGEIKKLPPAPSPKADRIPIENLKDELKGKSLCHGAMVLIQNPKGKPAFFTLNRVEESDIVSIKLKSDDAFDSAFLSELRREKGKALGIAYKLNGFLASLSEIKQISEVGTEHWTLILKPEDRDYGGGSMEMAFQGYSADDIAKLRARRILLDEKQTQTESLKSGNINAAMLESLIQGVNTPLKAIKSPFPGLFKHLKENMPLFIEASRLFGVLLLRLTGVVEHVYKLDLEVENEREMKVDFEGQRFKKYTNIEPPIIRVHGFCQLA